MAGLQPSSWVVHTENLIIPDVCNCPVSVCGYAWSSKEQDFPLSCTQTGIPKAHHY